MKAVIRGHELTRDTVIAAMKEYDDNHRAKVTTRAQKFMLRFKRKEYPPKKIISLATSMPTSKFSGGIESNKPLEKLGFKVVSFTPKEK